MAQRSTPGQDPGDNAESGALSPRVQAILRAATAVFLERGYGATSIDEIVARARSSKATVYKSFGNKERLFAAVVDSIVGEIEQPIDPIGDDPDEDLRTVLVRVAAEHLSVVLSERHARLMRMVAAEAARFPELGELYYSHGPALGHRKVADFLATQIEIGSIECADPTVAAEDFWGIVLHHGTLRRLYAVADEPDDSEIQKQAQNCVDRFLRLYPPL